MKPLFLGSMGWVDWHVQVETIAKAKSISVKAESRADSSDSEDEPQARPERVKSYVLWIHQIGGFLKWWYPTTMGFPTKNDHFGVFWGYHHLRKHPISDFI